MTADQQEAGGITFAGLATARMSAGTDQACSTADDELAEAGILLS